MNGAFATGHYPNVFAQLGYPQQEIEDRLNRIFEILFYGTPEQRIYHPVGDDMGYMEDTGNHDARTEGMSYGMMMCVQLNKKEEFDRLWKWARTYMYMETGANAGYFAWSCATDGTKNAYGPAPDGEEFFAMALFFASHRWGDGEGIFNYSAEARSLLHTCIHKGENGEPGRAMWDPQNKLIRFITEVDFTDPSYHLPHFYELFALWAEEADRPFWKSAAEASRAYLKKACHPVTGLCAEYAEFDGTPHQDNPETWGGRHDWYFSDSYRTVANIALDYSWFAVDDWACAEADRLQKFFCETVQEHPFGIYEVDGTVLESKALHPVAITAVNAQASLAAKGTFAVQCVKTFWDTPLRTGDRRYYDNCLYLFAFLALSGHYRIW
ncbi:MULTISPECIES: glycosyl hydrolase family 8 [Caproicibacterium]|uniref:Glycosyl hydrolase family 8 n=1 Tax=Caproicibacterium argilliputei TaxID=3030016 RepID=A0AA97D7D6_9FIRM|nr:glycosyl hydrolase family 8 [Caproicibacterium argilliputei]WOC31631.1 glycosyl hydrolase family 8 [Caproicibacterium argilliputei]